VLCRWPCVLLALLTPSALQVFEPGRMCQDPTSVKQRLSREQDRLEEHDRGSELWTVTCKEHTKPGSSGTHSTSTAAPPQLVTHATSQTSGQAVQVAEAPCNLQTQHQNDPKPADAPRPTDTTPESGTTIARTRLSVEATQPDAGQVSYAQLTASGSALAASLCSAACCPAF
jgi:hypothetical protein